MFPFSRRTGSSSPVNEVQSNDNQNDTQYESLEGRYDNLNNEG
mgnify:CR=1 FL=1